MILSTDLVHIVLDELRNHKRALARCTLVCRAWVWPSRTHLFREITIVLGRGASHLDDFLAILEGASDMRPHVRALHIKGREVRYAGCALRAISTPPAEVNLETLAACLRTLENLKSLRLQHVRYVRFVEILVPRPSFQIDNLTLKETFDGSLTTCAAIGVLSLFTDVHTLRLEFPHPPLPDASSVVTPTHMLTCDMSVPRITRLTFGESFGEALRLPTWTHWRGLLGRSSADSLTHVGVCCTTGEDLTTLVQLLEDMGQFVHSVDIDVWPHTREAELHHALSRLVLPGRDLTTLALSFNARRTYSSTTPSGAWALSASAIRSAASTLRHLVLRFYVETHYLHDLKDVCPAREYSDMDVELGSLPDLESVVIVMSAKYAAGTLRNVDRGVLRSRQEEFRRATSEIFPALTAAGMLIVQFTVLDA